MDVRRSNVTMVTYKLRDQPEERELADRTLDGEGNSLLIERNGVAVFSDHRGMDRIH